MHYIGVCRSRLRVSPPVISIRIQLSRQKLKYDGYEGDQHSWDLEIDKVRLNRVLDILE